MTKIKQLIDKLLSDSVNMVKLGDHIELYTGVQFNKNNMTDEGTYPVINGGILPSGYIEQYNEPSNTITVSQGGASAGYVNYLTTPFWAGAHCFVVRPMSENVLLNRYLYHYIKQSELYLQQSQQGAGIPSVNREKIKGLTIPLPPLSIQQEIVSVLDSFTTLIDKMKQEVEKRKKQMEYYREKLLTFEDGECEWKTLGNIATIKGRIGFRGYTKNDFVDKEDGAISLSPGDIKDNKLYFNDCSYITWEKYEESPEIMIYQDDIILCKTGSTVGKVAIVEELPWKSTINPQFVVLKDIQTCNKFLFYVITKSEIQQKIKSGAGIGSVPNISQAKLSELEIPVPPLSKQRKIVSTLDKFESYISKLEKMIALRQKQYEYYREQLLTFE